ncbi:MAG: trypsin-like peptidase domain-containing protein, partial [Alphaproteobacteria bacterium]
GITEVKHVAADRDLPFKVRIRVTSGIDHNFHSTVSDGDVLAPGDKLSLIIDPLKDGRLSLDFRGHDGKVQELFPGTDVLRGENIRLPDPDKSPRYTIDPGEGVETFTIRFESDDMPGKPIIREISYLKTSEADVDVQETYSIEDGKETGNANLRKRYADFFSMAGDKEFLGVFSILSTATPHKTRGTGDQRVFETVAPSVVKVLTFDGHGSGFVVRGDGLIATNLHVVRGYSRVGINFFPGNRSGIDPDKTYFAEIVKVNEHADLALLKLQGDIPNLVPVRLAVGKTLKSGQDVHAIGHPHGIDWHYSKGPVGKVEKDFEWPSGFDKKVFHKADVILTPASINQGNSGGPLINDASEVVGITTFKKVGADGLNFAVSVDELSRLMKSEGSIRFGAMPKTEKFQHKPGVLALDRNKNGKSDLYLLYSRKRNRIFGIVDKNEDGEVDYYFLDENADEKIDARIYPRVIGSKRIYYWRIDTDLDGKADAVGLDRDGDWKPDKITPIRKPRKKSKSLLRYVG